MVLEKILGSPLDSKDFKPVNPKGNQPKVFMGRTDTETENSNSLDATAKSLQSCLTLCDPIDGSSPGSAVPGILQARTLEWVAISFSKPSQCIKKQRQHFSDKGPYSQSYAFFQ